MFVYTVTESFAVMFRIR